MIICIKKDQLKNLTTHRMIESHHFFNLQTNTKSKFHPPNQKLIPISKNCSFLSPDQMSTHDSSTHKPPLQKSDTKATHTQNMNMT
jgi:hypothetical protein